MSWILGLMVGYFLGFLAAASVWYAWFDFLGPWPELAIVVVLSLFFFFGITLEVLVNVAREDRLRLSAYFRCSSFAFPLGILLASASGAAVLMLTGACFWLLRLLFPDSLWSLCVALIPSFGWIPVVAYYLGKRL